MPVKNIKSTRPKIFIPTDSDAFVKIQIISDNGTVYTMIDTYGGAEANNHMINSPLITYPVTDKLGSFIFKLANDQGRFLNTFDGGEIVDIFSDKTDATTRIFRGKIDNVNYGVNISDGFFVEIDGRCKPEMADRTITGVEASVRSDVSLAGIFYNFFNDVTLTFWNGSVWAEATYDADTDTNSWSTTIPDYPEDLINMTYQHKKGLIVIADICKRVGLDCYIWYDGSKWTLRTFLKETITNAGLNVSYGTNLINLTGFGKDNTEIFNRVSVYGKTESDNILLLKTENNTASQTNLWIKELVINDSSLESMDEVKEKAVYELSQGILTPSYGKVIIVGEDSIKPGQLIYISVPYTPINGTYKIQSFTHTFGHGFTTSIELSETFKTITDVFVSKVDVEEFTDIGTNPNAMLDSYTIYFNESESKVVLNNTTETSGKIRLSDGETSGTVTSELLTMAYDITKCELRRYENFETASDTYEVTNDGTNWETYDIENPPHTFQSVGNKVGWRITMNRTLAGDTSPAYESICLLVK